jgi:DNA-binding CsgD family transcriptional regulator
MLHVRGWCTVGPDEGRQRALLASSHTSGRGDRLEPLTGRELEVAELIRVHATNREIANERFLSLKTVETHIRNIFNELGVSSRGEIARQLAVGQPA